VTNMRKLKNLSLFVHAGDKFVNMFFEFMLFFLFFLFDYLNLLVCMFMCIFYVFYHVHLY